MSNSTPSTPARQEKQARNSKPTRIVRAAHDSKYFAVSRETAQDKSLSWEARGMLVYLLSKPDSWEVQPKDLEQGCSHGKVYKLLKELRDAHYLLLQAERDEKKRITGYYYTIYETPYAETKQEKPVTEKQQAAFQQTENRHIRYNREEQKTEGREERLTDSAFQERALYYRAYEMGHPESARPRVPDTRKNQQVAQFLYANGYEPLDVIALVQEKIAAGRTDYRFEYLQEDMPKKRLEGMVKPPNPLAGMKIIERLTPEEVYGE